MPKRKTLAEIEHRMKAIDHDARYHYTTATVVENAPLALVQLAMETEMRVLAWVSGLPELKPRRRR